MNSKWTKASREAIIKSLSSYEQSLTNEEEFNIKEAIIYVSSQYPFGQRINHPYKQWCRQVKIAKKLLNMYSPQELMRIDWDECLKVPTNSKLSDERQLNLFD